MANNKNIKNKSEYESIALKLRDIYDSHEYCKPIRDDYANLDIDSAYRIQDINTDYWLEQGRQLVGRKLGLTSKVVQKQLGVDQPDYGMLFADMAITDSEAISFNRLHQPKIEGEIAFYLNSDLDSSSLTCADVIAAIEYAVSAFEIVGSRINNWDISITDTIADNASSSLFVLGTEAKRLDEIDLRLCGAVVERFGEPVSTGAGAACLGNPINATLWLARKMVEVGRPLKSGDLVLSGALGPMTAVNPGDIFDLRISGFSPVRAIFSEE